MDNDVSELLAELVKTNPVTTTPAPTLTKENIEEFLIQHSGKLIAGGVEFVETLKNAAANAPGDAEGVEAVAKVYAGVAAAIAELNKIYTTSENNKAREKLKKMDIESKRVMQDAEITGALMMNRETLMADLFKKAKAIEVDVTPTQARLELTAAPC